MFFKKRRESWGKFLEKFFPSFFLKGCALSALRGEKSPFIDELITIPPRITDPPLVDVGIVAGFKAHDPFALGMVGALFIRMDLDIAPLAASGTDRVGRFEIPDAAFEPEISVSQCPDGADIDDISGIFVVELLPRVDSDFGMVPPVKNAEFMRL